MRTIIYSLLLAVALQANAQFYYFPFPQTKNHFKKVEAAGITVCYEYKLENGEKTLLSVLEYGAKGLPVVWLEKGANENGDSITISETTYKYNKDISIESITIDNHDDDFAETSYYSYDAKGRLIKKEVASIDPPTYKYSYNTKGQLIKAKVTVRMPAYDINGDPTNKSFDKPQSSIEYRYDAKNRLKEEWQFFAEGGLGLKTPDRKIVWQYDSKNNITLVRFLDNEGNTSSVVNLEYNEWGLLKKKSQATADGSTEVSVYEYCTTCKQSWMQ